MDNKDLTNLALGFMILTFICIIISELVPSKNEIILRADSEVICAELMKAARGEW